MKFIKLILLISILFFAKNSFAQGYEIKVKIDNYEGKSAKLGFHYGNKQYIKDSAKVEADGWMTFKGAKELDAGIYLLIMQPKNVYFELLVEKGQQNFSCETDTKDIPAKMKIKGSKENEIYYEYLNTVSDKREALQTLKDETKTADAVKKVDIAKKITAKETEIDLYQRDFIKKNTETFAAAIVRASKDIDLPTFTGTDNEMRTKRYFWYKQHFFDNYDLGNDRMIRTPLEFSRVDYYVTKLTSQQPDSIIQSVDRVLDMMKTAPDAFKFFCTHYLNLYAKSDIIGQDAVYVHMAKKYYEKGLTPWVAKDQVDKIIENANSLTPTLLGKTAMDFTLTLRDGKKITLSEIKSPYTIVMFWAPDCGHCKEEMPDVVKFYEKWKNKGVYLLGVCNRMDPEKIPECWQFMDERPNMTFPVGCDLYLKSNTQTNYYVKSTPMVFILDKDKKIIMKKINPKQMDEIMEEIVKIEEENKQIEKKK